MKCEYGCDQKAKYPPRKGMRKWCCSEYFSQCPEMRKRFISAPSDERVCDRCGKSISKCGWKQHRSACRVNICLNCGKSINKRKKFCDHRCAAIYSNTHSKKLRDAKRGPQKQKQKYCAICNKLLKSNQKLYCSSICRDKVTELKILNGEHVGPRTIKKYLIKTRGHQCEICGNTEWIGNPIPLIADHIDGNSYNNSLENRRLVCGNCDMQLPTYKGRNAGKGRYKRRQRYREGKSY